jgi:hypothetical protein
VDDTTRPITRPSVARATDVTVLATLAVLAALAVAARARVDEWVMVVAGSLGFGAAFIAAGVVARRRCSGRGRFLLHAASVVGALLFTYAVVKRLQLGLHERFFDAELVAFQQRIVRGQPVLWLEDVVRPWLTEWMMFSYVAYLALYPLVCGGVWLRGGEEAVERCLLALALANTACAAGFVLFPVAGPHFFLSDRFTVPLEGGPFAALGELIRRRAQYPGASLPSPHCAYATVLWLTAWRHRRRLALALAPVLATLYVATVYGRFHYAADAVAGIVTGVAALVAASWLGRRFAANACRRNAHPVS